MTPLQWGFLFFLFSREAQHTFPVGGAVFLGSTAHIPCVPALWAQFPVGIDASLTVPSRRNVLLLILWAWLSLTTPKHLLFLRLPLSHSPEPTEWELSPGISLHFLRWKEIRAGSLLCFLPCLESKSKNSALKNNSPPLSASSPDRCVSKWQAGMCLGVYRNLLGFAEH